MKNLFKYLASIAILSFFFYKLTIFFIPNIIYSTFYNRSKTNRGVSDNEISYSTLPTDESRAVVMPNPDFAYVSCFYDVSEGPFRLTGTLPDSTYWSVAFYQPNTINWYVKNDLQYGTNQLDLILAKEGESLSNNSTEVAYSPSDKGFLLVRILVTDNAPAVVKKYTDWQETIKMERLE